jgi:hypothetical protein
MAKCEMVLCHHRAGWAWSLPAVHIVRVPHDEFTMPCYTYRMGRLVSRMKAFHHNDVCCRLMRGIMENGRGKVNGHGGMAKNRAEGVQFQEPFLVDRVVDWARS